jgi:nucleoside-diphosphate-sugar epimerase
MFVQLSALGKMPLYLKGIGTEAVGVEDAAEAFLRAAERGRIGQRYIVSETYMSMRELFGTAARAVGAKPPRLGLPLPALYVVGYFLGAASRLLRRDFALSLTGCDCYTSRRRWTTARRCGSWDGIPGPPPSRSGGQRGGMSTRVPGQP